MIKFIIFVIMFKKLYDYLKENNAMNLYILHKETTKTNEIYSLTHPILPPEHEITTFFEKPSYANLNPDEQLSYKLSQVKKPSSFGESFGEK